MKIYGINKTPVVFKGYSKISYVDDKNSLLIRDEKIHTTSFFRDFPTLDFTQNYIKKTFSKGTNIAEFGCSQGQKGYSLMMMLDDCNADKKYKYQGFDFELPIDDANRRIYRIDSRISGESAIFNDSGVKSKFFKFFHAININANDTNSIHVMPNNDKFSGVIKFKKGDILDMNSIFKQKQRGVIIFQNALYHILYDARLPSETNLKIVKKIFDDSSKNLSKDGIFVLGSLTADHAYSPAINKQTSFVYQNNEKISVFKSTIIHELLKKAGFSPIFYQKPASITNLSDVHLPSVWKKIR